MLREALKHRQAVGETFHLHKIAGRGIYPRPVVFSKSVARGEQAAEGFINYCLPLIQGETGMVKEDGLPRFVNLKRVFAK